MSVEILILLVLLAAILLAIGDISPANRSERCNGRDVTRPIETYRHT